jgi:Protein of unknown function (DUF2846)
MKNAARLIAVIVLAGVVAVPLSIFAQSPATVLVNAPAGQAKATIIFYRPGAFYGKALKPSIYVDGNEIGRLKSGKYISYQTTVGKHSLSSSKKDAEVEVSVSSDQAQYVEMLIQSGTWRGAGRLVPVPAEEGKHKADQLKLQED